MNALTKLIRENRNVRRLLRPEDYWQWLMGLGLRLPQVIARRSLGPADDHLGEELVFHGASGLLRTRGASLGVVREIFGHECYGSTSSLGNCRHILDLGANAGVFSLFALSSAPNARVHLVEAQPQFITVIRENLKTNGLETRATVENALVGGATNDWARGLRQAHPDITDFSMEAYLDRVRECDFMKCDVEGAEFVFFAGAPAWLRRVRRMALEYHGDWAAGSKLGEILRSTGFAVRQAAHGSLGYLYADRA